MDNSHIPSTAQLRNSTTTQYAFSHIGNKIPLWNKMHHDQKKRFLMFAIIPLSVMSIGSFVYSTLQSEYSNARLDYSSQVEIQGQRMSALSLKSTTGYQGDFDNLASSYVIIENNLEVLDKGKTDLPATRSTVTNELGELKKTWHKIEIEFDKIKGYTPALMLARESHERIDIMTHSEYSYISTLINQKIQKGVVMPSSYERAKSDDERRLFIYKTLQNDIVDLNRLLGSLMNSTNIQEGAFDSIIELRQRINRNVISLLEGDTLSNLKTPTAEDKELLTTLAGLNVNVNNAVNDFVEQLPIVENARKDAESLFSYSETLLAQSSALTRAYRDVELPEVDVGYRLAMIAGSLAVLLTFIYAMMNLAYARRSQQQIEESIFALMDDLNHISDGDFRITARVAEDITGSIAGAVNFMTMDLRDSFALVRKTSEDVYNQALLTREISEKVRLDVKNQKEIVFGATEGVFTLTSSTLEVSELTNQAVSISERQRLATDQGHHTVSNVIQSLSSLREDIQDASKKIKRVGESAQEIGSIIELITDISEQTSVLALNASIQAAAAGEAGRGFRAVAVEVQKLAERTELALVQIQNHINSVQADTGIAISAMEKSTQQVVEVTQIGHETGEALSEIAGVAGEMLEIISSINKTMKIQEEQANKVQDQMTVLLDGNEAAEREVLTTVENVGTIAESVAELQDAMQQFKID